MFITSQIDRPLNDPLFIVINSEKSVDIDRVKRIVSHKLKNLGDVTNRLIEGEYPLV